MRRPALTLLAGLFAFPLALTGATAVAAPGAAAADDVVFRFQDPDVFESSGLVVQDGFFVTLNDSGSAPRLFKVDPLSGETVGTTRWGRRQVDAEALAPASGSDVWVGDIGDNDGARSTISVTRVGIGGGSEPKAYRLAYPDGSHDAEALLADPVGGRLFIVTKDVLGGEVYAAPEVLDPQGVNQLVSIGRVLGIATDGAFFPNGRHLILRDYSRAVVYSFPDLELVGEFTLPYQRQGEGLAVASDGTIYVSSEGRHAPVLRVELPDFIREGMRVQAPTESPSPAPAPTEVSSQSPLRDASGALVLWPWVLAGAAAVAGAATGLMIRHGRRKR